MTYVSATTLTGAVAVNAGSGAITFSGTVNGPQSLAANSTGTTTFNAAVGGGTALTSLTTDASGTTAINANVTTTGAQTYNDSVRIDSSLTLATTNSAVSFASTIDSQATEGNNLTINTGTAAVTFGGTIGGAVNGALGTLTINNTAAAGQVLPTLTAQTLNVTTGGAITDTGALTVAGTTTLTAGSTNDITLDNADDFGTVAITSGHNVILNDTNSLILGASTVSGTLNVTTNGTITQSAALGVTGTTTMAAGAGNNITLNNASNDFSTVVITSGKNVTLDDANALDLGTSTVSGTLNVTTGGAITDSGALTVTGATTLAAGSGNDITLDNADDFSTVAITSGRNVTLNDTNALDLGASTVSGTLTVTSNGDITNSGSLAVSGVTTLTPGAANSVILNQAGNNFVGAVSVTNGTNVTLVDANGLDLGPITITGGLTTTATLGNITNTGALTIGGNSLFTANAAGASISVNNAGNNFTGTVSFAGAGGLADVTVVDTTALDLTALTLTGNLTVSSGGAITESGTLAIAGTGNFNAGSNAITLGNANTANFGSLTVTGGAATVTEGSPTQFTGASTATSLTLTANGAITQTGGSSVSVSGTSALNASGGNVTLTQTGNDFGTVTLSAVNDVALVDANALNLGASTVAGTLTLTAGSHITQSGVLNVTGLTTVAVTTPSSDILLGTQANDLGTSATAFGGTTADVRDVSLRSTNAGATVSTFTALTNLRNLTLIYDNIPVVVPNVTASGNLSVTAGGAITDAPGTTLAIGGQATFNAGTNDITLGDSPADNTNFGSLSFTGGAVTITEDSATVFTGTNTATGAFTLTSAGSITNNPGTTLNVTGKATLNAGGNAITLGNNSTDTTNFGSLNFTGGAVAITENSSMDAGGTASASLALIGVGVNLAGINTPTLTVNSTGPITDSGPSVVPGLSKFNAHGFDIVLDDAGNNFGTVQLGGAAITLFNVSSINLAGVQASGAFNLKSAGNVTVGAPINGGSSLSLASGGGDLIINASISTTSGDLKLTAGQSVVGSEAGTLTTAGGLVTVLAGANVQLGALTTAGGGISVTAGGTADFISPLTVSGPMVVTAPEGITFDQTLDGSSATADVTLNTTGVTRFSGAIGSQGGPHTLTTDAGGTTAINGGSVTTTGAQIYNDAVTLGAGTTFTSTGSGNVTFMNTVNGAQTLAVNTAGTTTFGGLVGGTTALISLTTDAAGTTAINGGAVTTTGAQTYNDPVLLGASATMTASALTFNNTLNTGSGLITLSALPAGESIHAVSTDSDLTANVTGATIFKAAVGQTGRLGNVTVTGTGTASTAEIHANFSSDSLIINNPLTLESASGLTIDTTGAQVYASTVTTQGTDLTFNSALDAVFSTTATSPDGISFAQGLSASGRTVTITAPTATIRAGGNLGTSDARLSSLTATGRYMVVGGDIWADGDIALAIGTHTDAGNDFLQFTSPDGSARSTFVNSATGEIRLGSGAVAGTAEKTGAPVRSSIFKSNDGDLYLFAHKVTVEPFERLVVRNGSLVAIADGTDSGDWITLSNTAASNYLVLVSSTPDGTPGIRLQSRGPANIDPASGSPTPDQGTDLVAGAVFFFNTHHNDASGGPFPTREAYAPVAATAPTATATFDYQQHTGNIVNAFGPATISILPDSAGVVHNVYVADMVLTNRFRPVLGNLIYLDLSTAPGFSPGLHIDGLGPFIDPAVDILGLTASQVPLTTLVSLNAAPRTVLQSTFTPNVPHGEAETAPPEVDLAAAVREQLQALGIYARPLRPEEKVSRERRMGLFVTVPEREIPRDSEYEVADARVENRAVREVLRLASAAGLIGGDRRKLDEIAGALASSYEAFTAESANTEASYFRVWLQASSRPDAAQVLKYVKTLAETLRRIELLGLTGKELASSKAQIYGSILRARLNADPEFFRALVEGAPPAATRVSVRDPQSGHPDRPTSASLW